MTAIRVLVVDDQPLARAGIKMLLQAEEDIDIVAEAADGEQALTQARAQRPDVILMDVRMPGTDGVEATRAVIDEGLTSQTGQPIGIIIFTTYDIDEAVYAALRAGASGFVIKDAAPIEIVAAIHAVATGEAWLDPTITRRLIDQFTTRPKPSAAMPAEMDLLTPREREVLILLAQGLSSSEVSRQLYISEATVKTHLAHVMAKLGVRDKAQAVIAAYQSGLVRVESGDQWGYA
jgi:DNA-binding NarL/FixJ family response regulator